jgi:hypothetical protein
MGWKEVVDEGIPVRLRDLTRTRSPAAGNIVEVLGLTSRVDGHVMLDNISASSEGNLVFLEIRSGRGEVRRQNCRRHGGQRGLDGRESAGAKCLFFLGWNGVGKLDWGSLSLSFLNDNVIGRSVAASEMKLALVGWRYGAGWVGPQRVLGRVWRGREELVVGHDGNLPDLLRGSAG